MMLLICLRPHLSLVQNKVLMKHLIITTPMTIEKYFYDKFIDNNYVTRKYVGKIKVISTTFMLMTSNLKTIQKPCSSHHVYTAMNIALFTL